MKHVRQLSVGVCLGLAFAGLSASGCGNRSIEAPINGSAKDLGELALGLQVAPFGALTSVAYVITGPSAFSKTGAIDVSNSSTISSTIGAIPAGLGYSIALSSSLPAGLSCSGSATFDIAARKTTPVTVQVRCHEAPRLGSIAVSGSVNVCPVIDGVSAAPGEVYVGASLALGAQAHDSDAGPSALLYQWSTTSGILSSATSANPTFTCSAPGSATVTLQVSDGDASPTCADTTSINVVCTPPVCPVSCDDNNPCTNDVCGVTLSCEHSQVADGSLCSGGNLRVKLLGFNDFHGQISVGRTVSGRPVGSAAVLASYLKAAQAGVEAQTLIVHAGDHVGASPPSSALLQDEPSISFLNALANPSCSYGDKMNPACNLVGTLGNHEFDEGKNELLRLLNGGNFVSGPFLEDPYQGARFPYVSANVVDEVTDRPIIPPYVIKMVQGVPIAFVGAVLRATPTIVTPTGVAGLKFVDEADAANSYVPELKAMGVKALVLLIHQGGSQGSYTGPTSASKPTVSGADILNVTSRLDAEFDVVVSGHSHSFTNTFVNNAGGKPMLLTQAFSASTAYADVDLLIDPVSHDVVSKSAQIVTTFADAGPGLTPDPAIAAMTTKAEATVAPLVNQVVGFASRTFTRTQNAAGESELGDIIADSQRLAMGTQFAFMNPGGIRADLTVPTGGGNITWGALFTIQPFGNSLVKMSLTGAQIQAVLEQQWQPTVTRQLQISGLSYTWDNSKPSGSKIVEVRDSASGLPLDPTATYTVTVNNFLAAGGDGFTVLTSGTGNTGGPIDLDALVDYADHNNPLPVPAFGRITRLN